MRISITLVLLLFANSLVFAVDEAQLSDVAKERDAIEKALEQATEAATKADTKAQKADTKARKEAKKAQKAAEKSKSAGKKADKKAQKADKIAQKAATKAQKTAKKAKKATKKKTFLQRQFDKLVALYNTLVKAAQESPTESAPGEAEQVVIVPEPQPQPDPIVSLPVEIDPLPDDLEVFIPDTPIVAGKSSSASQLSRFGITWHFKNQVRFGKFANGAFWVIGPVSINQITPGSKRVEGVTTTKGFSTGFGKGSKVRIMNGSMINPSPKSGLTQGYDNETYQWHPTAGRKYGASYSDKLNVALNVSNGKPLVLKPGTSLVSTISLEKGFRPQVKTAAILTVLSKVPPEGSFRPAYSGTDKTVKFNVRDLRFGLLEQLPLVDKTPSLNAVAKYFEKPWIDHVPGFKARYIHPSSAMPDYGRDLSTNIGIGALMLHMNFSDAAKETLLIRYVQLGIDLMGIVKEGGVKNWVPNGGHGQGRKWPILFAGYMLGDSEMKNIGKSKVIFSEDAQTFFVNSAAISITNSGKWNVDKRNLKKGKATRYSGADIGLPEWGIRHRTDPNRDNRHWSAIYRNCCTANSFGGYVLAAHIMGLKGAWNHDPIFDYLDRFKSQGEGQVSPFVNSMWKNYRQDYGRVWRP